MEGSTSDRLLQDESKKEGAVAFHVYRAYWRAMGPGLALAILFSLLLMQGRQKPCCSYPTIACCLGPHHLVLIVTLYKAQRPTGRGQQLGARGMSPVPRIPGTMGVLHSHLLICSQG